MVTFALYVQMRHKQCRAALETYLIVRNEVQINDLKFVNGIWRKNYKKYKMAPSVHIWQRHANHNLFTYFILIIRCFSVNNFLNYSLIILFNTLLQNASFYRIFNSQFKILYLNLMMVTNEINETDDCCTTRINIKRLYGKIHNLILTNSHFVHHLQNKLILD